MKVVHLNTYDGNGGAGRAVLRLNQALNESGIQSQVLTLYQFNARSGVRSVSSSLPGKARAVFNIFAERYLIKPFLKDPSVPFSLQRFGIAPSGLNILKETDIIHIHWINHGFLSPADLALLKQLNKKIVWTFHDSNPITGGCHVRYTCIGFKDSCGFCPVLKNSASNDLSHRTWAAKQKAYAQLPFTVIAPSGWMGKSVQAASLTRNKPVEVIANALETDLFVPGNKQAARKALGIDENDVVLLAGYMPSKADRHKGFKQLTQALSHLVLLSQNSSRRLLLLFYGSAGQGMDKDIPLRHRFAGRISDDAMLVNLYIASDVFLFPSLEESMGYTALESLSCGTPVVGFQTSGVTDVVRHKENGYLAPLGDAKAFAQGILWILDHPHKEQLSDHGRQWAVQHFSLKAVAQKHSDLYKKLI